MLLAVQVPKVHEMLMMDLLDAILVIHREAYEEVLLYTGTQQKSTKGSSIIVHYSNSPLTHYYLFLRVTDFFVSL